MDRIIDRLARAAPTAVALAAAFVFVSLAAFP